MIALASTAALAAERLLRAHAEKSADDWRQLYMESVARERELADRLASLRREGYEPLPEPRPRERMLSLPGTVRRAIDAVTAPQSVDRSNTETYAWHVLEGVGMNDPGREAAIEQLAARILQGGEAPDGVLA